MSFNPYFNGYTTFTARTTMTTMVVHAVSILILMDILLLHIHASSLIKKKCRFNPYFNGYTTFTRLHSRVRICRRCFNPYFNGYTTFTLRRITA